MGSSIQLHGVDTLLMNQILVVLDEWTYKMKKLLWSHRLVITCLQKATVKLSLPASVNENTLNVEANHILKVYIGTERVGITDINAFDIL